ncbi:hypothetical protein LguiA_005489 [Lonicera macranthoides]
MEPNDCLCMLFNLDREARQIREAIVSCKHHNATISWLFPSYYILMISYIHVYHSLSSSSLSITLWSNSEFNLRAKQIIFS